MISWEILGNGLLQCVIKFLKFKNNLNSIYLRFRNPYKITDEKPRRRVVKGGSFLDTRDPRSLSEKMRIRISARMGRVENYTAQNLGFRCAQSIKPNEKTKFGDKNFRIVQFRQPKKFKPDGTHEEL